MRKLQREKGLSIGKSLEGIAFVIVCIMAFLFVMEMFVVVVRFFVG